MRWRSRDLPEERRDQLSSITVFGVAIAVGALMIALFVQPPSGALRWSHQERCMSLRRPRPLPRGHTRTEAEGRTTRPALCSRLLKDEFRGRVLRHDQVEGAVCEGAVLSA